MRQYILFFFCCITFSNYGQSIDDVFKTMPEEFIPAFTEYNKTMLLVDTSFSVIPYPLGKIKKLEYSATSLSVKTSEVATLQIKLLPLVNNTQIISVIKTVCGNVCDSNIRFFTDKWKEIDKNSLLPDIKPNIFFDSSKLNALDFKVAASHINIYPLSFQFDKESNDLTVKFDFAGFLSSEDLRKIGPFVEKESVVLSWNKSTFVFK